MKHIDEILAKMNHEMTPELYSQTVLKEATTYLLNGGEDDPQYLEQSHDSTDINSPAFLRQT